MKSSEWYDLERGILKWCRPVRNAGSVLSKRGRRKKMDKTTLLQSLHNPWSALALPEDTVKVLNWMSRRVLGPL